MVYFFLGTCEGSKSEPLLINQPMSNYLLSILCVSGTRLCGQRFISYSLCFQNLHLIEECTPAEPGLQDSEVKAGSVSHGLCKREWQCSGRELFQTTWCPLSTRVAGASQWKGREGIVAPGVVGGQRLRNPQQTGKLEFKGRNSDHGQK